MLPVNPDAFELYSDGNIEVVDIVAKGQVSSAGHITLKRTTIQSFFPANGDIASQKYVDEINSLRETKKPLNLVVTNAEQIDMLVLIERFEWSKQGAFHLNIDYRLDLIEYIPYGAEIIEVVEENEGEYVAVPTPPPRSVENKPPTPRTHTIVRGDNLYNLARKYSGNPQNWRELYDLNKEVVGNNPDLIFAGQVLNIPESWVL